MKTFSTWLLCSFVAPVAAQASWNKPTAPPVAEQPQAEPRSPPTWVRDVASEVEAAVSRAMAPIAAALAAKPPAAVPAPAPTVVAGGGSWASEIPWELIAATVLTGLGMWITKQSTLAAVRAERGAPKSEVVEALKIVAEAPRQQAAPGWPTGPVPGVPRA